MEETSKVVENSSNKVKLIVAGAVVTSVMVVVSVCVALNVGIEKSTNKGDSTPAFSSENANFRSELKESAIQQSASSRESQSVKLKLLETEEKNIEEPSIKVPKHSGKESQTTLGKTNNPTNPQKGSGKDFQEPEKKKDSQSSITPPPVKVVIKYGSTQTPEDLKKTLLQCAKDPYNPVIDPSVKALDVNEYFQKENKNIELMKGVAVFCDALSSQSKNERDFHFWKSLSSLARAFQAHTELGIKEPMEYGKAFVPDIEMITKIPTINKNYPLFDALSDYEFHAPSLNAEVAKNSNQVYVELSKLKAFLINAFYIPRNNEKYPGFIKAYDEFVLKLNSKLASKLLNRNLFLDPNEVFKFHRYNFQCNVFLLSDSLSDDEKTEIVEAMLYDCVVVDLTNRILDFGKIAYDPKKIEDFKRSIVGYFEENAIAAYIFQKSGPAGPQCDKNGIWIQPGNASQVNISNRLRSEVEREMAIFCAANKMKPAKSILDKHNQQSLANYNQSEIVKHAAIEAFGAKITNSKSN